MGPKGPPLDAAPEVTDPAQLRNVVLVGPSGAGKSELFERLIAATTEGYRRKTVGESRSVQLNVASVSNGQTVLNVIDTPGYADFAGELRAGLRAADAALFVISAADGVDGQAVALWKECAAVNMPRGILITKLDAARTSFAETLAVCQDAFGAGVVALYQPLRNEEGAIIGNFELLSRRVHDYRDRDREPIVRAATDAECEIMAGRRTALIETVIQESEDDTLLERYLAGSEPDAAVLIADLLIAIAHGTCFPVVPSASERVGTHEVLFLMESGFPPPTLHGPPNVIGLYGSAVPQLRCDPDGPLIAEVIRTTSDPFVGRVSLIRVFSGTLRPDVRVHVSGHLERFTDHQINGHPDHDDDERTGVLSSPLAETLRTKSEAISGDICFVAKLLGAQTADTLSDPDAPALIEPWQLPEALLPVAIRAVSKSDDDKLGSALQRLATEDPTMRLERNTETHQLVVWTLGQAHVDLLLGRLEERYAVRVEPEPVRVALRETFATATSGTGRHVKQSGGHGQFGVCTITVEPLPRGAGFEFVDKIVGGAVPRNLIPSVEKGVRVQMQKGCLAGYPLVDVRVTLTDGKSHSVDSSDMAFQLAGALALREAAAQPDAISLLEPVDSVTIRIDDEYVGAVMTDLQTRRGRVLSTEPEPPGHTIVQAEVPQTELLRYVIDLRSITRGTGTFTRNPLGYEPLPSDLAQQQMSRG
ncbi:translation elongation factor 2 (EF-2/EF-G) [Antricoccus suffuscus]|uniref:Translation elongation factor 2 (EF-2/EF-G) n=1 Tax=Antricoccus suffuscus TaxID=1629062 RepID=A0A2T1A4P8_9ACTN|nr:elongation factor G-like protein EF-G2 [Antricoccus suffuscus]PRZ43524.1 translation elongation factor 2 (EF-2/EF-G) [Antricoccus suffuscus]